MGIKKLTQEFYAKLEAGEFAKPASGNRTANAAPNAVEFRNVRSQ